MSCGNQSDINQTFIIEPVSAESVISGCSGIYTNVVNSCSGNTSIFLGTDNIFVNGSISATTYYGDGSNLTGVANNTFRPDAGNFSLVSIQDDVNYPNAANGEFGFAIGQGTQANGFASYAQGVFTIAQGDGSHAEGINTLAQGFASHAGGINSQANSDYSFVHGSGSSANAVNAVVLGANLNGVFQNTTHVDNLNINTLGTGNPITNLAIDANGNVTVGMQVIIDVNLVGNTLEFLDSTGGTFVVKGVVNTATTLDINGNIYNLNDNREWRVAQSATGVLSYEGAFVHSSTTINVGAVNGYVIDNETNPLIPTHIFLEYTGETGVTVTSIGTGTGSYVLLQSNNTLLFQNDYPTSQQRKENILLSKVGHPNGIVTFVINEPDFILSPVSQFRDIFKSIKYINDGVYAYPNGNNLLVNISGGFIFGNGINFVVDNQNPNQVAVGPLIPTTFVYRTQTGGTAMSVSAITPSFYDVAGVITPVPSTASTIQWIFNVPSAGFAIQYGQTLYSSLNEAVIAVGKEEFVVFPNLIENAILIGVLAVTSTATTLSAITEARFFRADKFGQIVGSTAGVGTSTLQDSYDNSMQPQITITPTGGALQIKAFNASDGILQGLSTAGTTTFNVDGFGNLSATTLHGATGGTIGLILGNQGIPTVDGTSPIAEFNDQTGEFSDLVFRVAGDGIPVINLVNSNGTLEVPTTSNGLNQYGEIIAWGYTSAYTQAASIYFNKDGTPTNTSIPSSISFNTTPIGSVTEFERFSIDNQGQLTINATPSDGTTNDTILVRTSAGNVRVIPFTSTIFTGGTISGETIFTGGLSANTFSATSILATSISVDTISAITLSATSISVDTISATSISATTYLNLPLDITITGGTLSSGTTTLTNNTGGTVVITGYTYIPHLEYDNSNKTIWNNGNGNLGSNTSFGEFALGVNATGDDNTAIGALAMAGNTSASFNVAVGSAALFTNSAGTLNTAVGVFSLYLSTGNNNTAVGAQSMQNSTTGFRNTAIGEGAGFNLKTGNDNTGIGYASIGGTSTNLSGTRNIAVGFQAGRDITSGSSNILIENITNASVTTGSNNIIINPVQQSGIHTGSNNTIIGGYNNTIPDGSNQVIIGTGIGARRLEFNSVGQFRLPVAPTASTSTDNILVRDSVTGFIGLINTNSLIFSGGTVSGATYFSNGLSANTFSATTYLGLPADVYVTGGTFSPSSSTIIFTNSTGGTFVITGITVSSSGSFSGGTVTGPTYFSNGVSANTISATTYLGLPPDVYVTGGTMLGNTAIFTNTTGGSFNVNGIVNTATTLNINGNAYNLNNNREWVTAQGSTGVLSYGGAFIHSSTTINIGAAKGYIVDNESNPLIPSYIYLDYTGETGVTVTTIGGGVGSYVLLTSANTITFQNTYPTSKERKENILLSKVGHPEGIITFVINEPDFILSPVSQIRDLFKSIKYINDGVYAYPNTGLSFNITGGFIFGNGVNFVVDDENPSQIAVGPYTSGTSFVYRTQTGGTTGFVSVIDPTKYDVGGVITPVPSTASTIQWIFNAPSATFAIQYGQTLYPSLNEAVIAVGKEDFTLFSNLIENAILIGVLAVVSTATTLSATSQARFFRADKFGQIIGAQAGVSTSTLQSAYDNSTQPQITIGSTGALQVKATTPNTVVFQTLNQTNTVGVNINGGGAMTGGTIFGTTQISSPIISAITYLNLPSATFTGGTVNGATIFTNGLSANTVSAGTYNGVILSGNSSNTSVIGATSGNQSLRLGSGNITGNGGFAGGLTSQATGTRSFAFGSSTVATSTQSIALGQSTSATSINALAIGNTTLAAGSASFAGGNNSSAYGPANFVFGASSVASGGTATIVLGNFITGTSNNTTYVDNLNIKTITGGTSVNNLGIDANGRVVIGTAGGGSGSFSGGTVTGPTIFTSGLTATTFNVQNITAGENLVYGNLVYLSNDGKYYKASNLTASTSSTELRLALASISANASGNALVNGQFTTTGLTAGDRYIIGTGGTITTTQPTTDYSIVRYVGTALSSTKLEFNPDETYLELINSTGSSSSSTFNGGVVNGATLFTNGLSANTISATTYLNLPSATFSGGSANCITDLYVTNFHGCSPITFHDNLILLSGLSATTITSPSIPLTAGSATNSWATRGSSITTAATNSFIFKTGVTGSTPNLVQVPGLRIHNIASGPATPNVPLALNSQGEVCFLAVGMSIAYTEANGVTTLYDGSGNPISTTDNKSYRVYIVGTSIFPIYDNTALGIVVSWNSAGQYIITPNAATFATPPVLTVSAQVDGGIPTSVAMVYNVDYSNYPSFITLNTFSLNGGTQNNADIVGTIKLEL